MKEKELAERLKEYNKTRNLLLCTELEKQFMELVEDSYIFSYVYKKMYTEWDFEGDVEEFLKQQRYFKGLLGEHHEKLCLYLRHVQEYICNDGLVRMDVRSSRFSRYKYKIFHAINSFYWFYGSGMSLKKLICGGYRNFYDGVNFSEVVAAELLAGNLEAEEYCREALTSENNTAVLTRGVIVGIERSCNKELQELLLKVFLAAKLQEGFRQSVVETADENNMDFFLETLDVIERENLLRFSSVQRAVLTWIGIGYMIIEEEGVRYIFEQLYRDFRMMREGKGLPEPPSENPLDIYIWLYCKGAFDMEEAIDAAHSLLDSDKRFIVASALVYLHLSNGFEAWRFLDLPEKYKDDEWILALFYYECAHGVNELESHLTKENAEKLFMQVECFLPAVGNRKTFSSKGFGWFCLTITKETLHLFMWHLLEQHPSSEMAEHFLPFVSSTLMWKSLDLFMEKYFCLAPVAARKRFMLKEIISSNNELGRWVMEEYKKYELTEEEIIQLEKRLTTKKASARAYIVEVLAGQKKELAQASYDRLKISKVKTIRESASELGKKAGLETEAAETPAADIITPIEIQGREEGFGLYDPKCVYEPESPAYLKMLEKEIDLKRLFPWNRKQALDYISRWGERITMHEDDEYLAEGEYRQVKDEGFGVQLYWSEKRADEFPLSETWLRYFEEDGLTEEEIFEIRFLLASASDPVPLEKAVDDSSVFFTLKWKEIKEVPYIRHFLRIFRYYFQKTRQTVDFSEPAAEILRFFVRSGTQLFYRKQLFGGSYEEIALTYDSSLAFVIGQVQLGQMDEGGFRKYFPVIYSLYNKYNLGCPVSVSDKFCVEPLDLARAVCLNMLPVEALYAGILDTHMEKHSFSLLGGSFSDAYFEGRRIYYYENERNKPHLELNGYRHLQYDCSREVFECLRNALAVISDRLLAMESRRLNEKTKVTDYVDRLFVVRGVKYLLLALRMLEGEGIKRRTYSMDKADVFADIIRSCFPESGKESEERETKLLASAGISEERLAEVAMLAPQWIDMIEKVTQCDSIKEARYYFVAHMKQYDLKHKKAEIAKYTELEPEDLCDGAFDMEWCKSVYEALGEKRFQMFYKSSKFLCDNAFHTRARKYADACLGKKGKEYWKEKVAQNRNKDALNAYCICPIEDDKDLLERYLYVQQFLKESKSFGSQRQASEKRAVEMALMNLARNSRFQTVTRLSWMMESEEVKQNEAVLSPRALAGSDVEVWIEIDGQGRNEIRVRKKGKLQKSIPAAYKKDEWVLYLKEIHKEWSEQHKRSRRMLEQAMEERTEFSKEELRVIMKNPIAAPMLGKLVLISEDASGFYDDESLGETMRIAHPYDLYERGSWRYYQKRVFDEGIVQPFKQVFRELYLKLEDEAGLSESRRYSGYQIQPKKAAAALKSRRWNVSYESGLERVYYKDNLIVNLYAEADWFSPSDIEAPAIEYVSFCSRKDGTPVPIRDIDPVTFSETMRDIDMAVSTAYVGGVDPVTSFSAMELRRTIAEYTCQLMKLDNVTVKDHFANIEGSLNSYSVHLGSGVVHQSGGSAIHIVPVHSGKRGKVYLPFLDEDPKTAEILSKIAMLSEDGKIKDPEVLRQIADRRM